MNCDDMPALPPPVVLKMLTSPVKVLGNPVVEKNPGTEGLPPATARKVRPLIVVSTGAGPK
jgi:hypothetical protein